MRKAKAPTMLMKAETPRSSRVAIKPPETYQQVMKSGGKQGLWREKKACRRRKQEQGGQESNTTGQKGNAIM